MRQHGQAAVPCPMWRPYALRGPWGPHDPCDPHAHVPQVELAETESALTVGAKLNGH